jgi:hypothetical protein
MRFGEPRFTGFTRQSFTYHNVITIDNNVITFDRIVGDLYSIVNKQPAGTLILERLFRVESVYLGLYG